MRKDANEIVSIIRVRPAMYLGKHSISRLRSLMDGYAWAVEDCTGSDDMFAPLGQFTWHLISKYQVCASVDWSLILLSRAFGCEEEALSLFWQEWDEFIAKPCTCPQTLWDNNSKIVWRYCRTQTVPE